MTKLNKISSRLLKTVIPRLDRGIQAFGPKKTKDLQIDKHKLYAKNPDASESNYLDPPVKPGDDSLFWYRFRKKSNQFFSIFIPMVFLSSICGMSQALTYTLPDDGSTILGTTQTVSTIAGDTLSSLGRRYSAGIIELLEANPNLALDKSYGPGQKVLVPTQFILPNTAHKGFVINLAELRLYFYVPGTREVRTFPIGVGREGWDTPLGETYITEKIANPTWIPTEHIKKARLEDGVVIPNKVGPGPDNPMGPYKFRTGLPSILIHGSNDPSGIGRRSSSGCIRMQPEAIENIFNLVPINLPITFVDEPVKVGWLGNDLYIESHIPLEDAAEDDSDNLIASAHKMIDAETKTRPAKIEWNIIDQAITEHLGYPIKIGVGVNPIPLVVTPLNPNVPVRKNQVHARKKIDPQQRKRKHYALPLLS